MNPRHRRTASVAFTGLFFFLATVTAAAKSGDIAARLQPFVDHHTLAGAVVLIADNDKVLDVETVGFADIASQKPMQPDSLFWIASQSKAMTAAALMMLVDEGNPCCRH